MEENTNLTKNFLSTYKTFESKLNGNNSSVLAERRKEAISSFEKLGFPTTKHEEWKYTNIAPALKKDFTLDAQPKISKGDIEPFFYKGLDAYLLVFVNGQYSAELSSVKGAEKSVVIKPFAEADSELLEKYFGKGLSVNDAFTYLNTAFAQAGSFIKILKGKTVDKPLVFYFISDSRSVNVFSQPRNLFLAEENSEVKIVESFHSIGSHSSFSNVVTEIILQKDARVEYYKVQNEEGDAYHVGTTQVHQEAKSVFAGTTISVGGSITRNNMNIVLNAEYCEATMYGLSLLKGVQHVDNHTIADHAKPNCLSNELYKAILDDKSSGVFNGKIFVKQDAQKTNAFQSNKNILLSKDASMNTKPQLEIFADDVKCSHGATIGQLDEEPLFYLRSRGISEEKAKALLVTAFAQDIIDHIKIEPLKEALITVISQRLGQ